MLIERNVKKYKFLLDQEENIELLSTFICWHKEKSKTILVIFRIFFVVVVFVSQLYISQNCQVFMVFYQCLTRLPLETI